MIGNTGEPGVTSTVRSAPSVTSSSESPGNPVLIGSADLQNGEANSDQVYEIERSADAQRLFGDESRLTHNVLGALNQGAQPVLAVAPGVTSTTQDISSISSTSGTLDNPAKEGEEEITVTVDSTDKTVEYSLEDVSGMTAEADTVLINPTTDEFELDATPSTSGSIEYQSLDYQTALNAVLEYTGDIDFVAGLKERSDVTTMVNGTVNQMQSEKKLAIAIGGLSSPVDADAFTNDYDTSRLTLYAGVRMKDFTSSLGSLVGVRANLGLTTTPINQQVPLPSRPYQGLDSSDRATLIGKFVVPLERIGESVRITDDLTTVSDQNSEEANMRYGFSRLAVDYLIETVHDLEAPFIGKYNSPGAIGQLEDLLNEGARPLSDSNVIYEYNAEVTMIDPTTAKVTFQADVAEPIRFIENEFVIGQNLELQNE